MTGSYPPSPRHGKLSPGGSSAAGVGALGGAGQPGEPSPPPAVGWVREAGRAVLRWLFPPGGAMHALGVMIAPYRRSLTMALGMLVGLTGVNLLVPILIGMVFHRVFPEGNWVLLWEILGAMALLFLARNALYFGSKYTAVSVGENVSFTLRNRLFERLQQMNLSYYRDNKPGQISSRIMNDSYVIQEFIQGQVPKLLQALLLFVGIMAVIFWIDVPLAIATTIVLPLHLLAFHYFRGRIKRASHSAQERLAEATANLIEKFLGMEVVKGFTAEAQENAAFAQSIDRSRRSQLESHRYHITQKVMSDLLLGLGTLSLLGFGAFEVIGGKILPSALLSFFLYVKMLYPTVIELMSGFSRLSKATASVDRVRDVLESPQRGELDAGGIKPKIEGELWFDQVRFAFPEGRPVLGGLSFHIPAGEVCAIVGPSGGGKTTTASLLPRFIEPTGGRVMLDRIDLRDIDVNHLRRHIGMVFQESFLFNATVRENLRYAKPDASRAEIREVARRVGVHELIEALPEGYDTVVGEGGVVLSRGQKQMITVARAMLKSPQMLILDEATASVDSELESRLIPAVLTLMKGKTTLLITHRQSLLEHADRLIAVEAGRIAYDGPVLPYATSSAYLSGELAPIREPQSFPE